VPILIDSNPMQQSNILDARSKPCDIAQSFAVPLADLD
jgi:hypothetical protein